VLRYISIVGNAPRRRPRRLEEADYARLARFRQALRRFLRFSENAARRAGISPAQYQLLLFVRAAPAPGAVISHLAERLQVRHQSAVGLIDRCQRAGLVRREKDLRDGRRAFVRLTAKGARVLTRLVLEHYRVIDDLRTAVPRPLSFRFPPD
jgi:DNA-binding MarR family transcriptional regulator